MTSNGRPFFTSSDQIRSILQPTSLGSMPPINYRSTALVARPKTASGFVDYQPLLRPSAVARASTGRSHSANGYHTRNLSVLQRPQNSNTRLVSAGVAGRRAHFGNRPKESVVLKRAPYGQRTISAPARDPLLPYSNVLPTYSSLHDPHLRRYYSNKFNLNGRPRSMQQKVDTMYVTTVRIGAQKNAGTIANLYLRMNGKSVRVNKQKLTKKTGLVDTEEYGSRYEFKASSENVFKLKGPQIKQMHSIVIESDGLLPEESCFVEEISIEDLRTKKTWTFPCENWLSLYETDCQLSRELFADPQIEKYQATDYEITTVTGSKFGAGTDANVFVTLYGDQGFSPRLNLYTPGEKKAPFERGRTDRFVVHTKDVGKMKKLRIEHDNTGSSSGWYLDHVLVKNARTSKQWFFPCQRWLAKDEDDGRICRDLLPKGHAAGDAKLYTVHVTTGNKSGAGTNANVFATIFGDKGDSGELALKGKGNLFEKGDTNEFPFELPDLGTLSKLRIRHDDSGLNSGWFLEKATVTFGTDVYEFPCNRWLAKDEDDGKISRDLIAKNAKGLLNLFEVTVITGDVRNSGTDAKVYLEMTSKNETSGRIWLEDGDFERKSTDTFKLDIAAVLGPLDTVTVGHDNSGRGPGWFLDKIVIFNPKLGLEQHFPCNKWLADDEDDGLIERTLNEDKSLRKKRDKETTWDVEVTTSDINGAGTNANIHMTLYGSEGHSEQIALENESDKFERGQVDQFAVQTPHIGIPTKLRIGHDDSGSASGWHLHKVEVTNRETSDKYIFNCDRWLATDEDDGEIIRELPAEGRGIKKPLTVKHYKLAVKTGGKFGAGTNADVFANIFGKHGDTGERSLKKSEHTNKFERNQIDTFTVEAVDLGDIEKLKIGHNGKGAGDGWFLDGVTLTCAEDSKLNVSFPCGRWLATDEDDGLLVRELFVAKAGKNGHDGQQHQDLLKTTTYKIAVKTGDIRNAGTDADVFLVIFGEKDDSGKIALARAENNKNPFERGKVDLFTVETEDLAKIKKILIGHNGKGAGCGWYLEDIEIAVPSRGETYRFVAQRWLDEDEADKQLQAELFPLETEKRDKTIPYELTITTGDVRNAGTDANVFIQIYGENGKTGEFQLNDKSNNFERANADVFKVDGHDVGRIQKIRIGHDGKGPGSGWFLDRVKIRKPPSKIEKRKDTLKKQKEVKRSGRLDGRPHSRLSSKRGSSNRGSFSESQSSNTETDSSLTDGSSNDESRTRRGGGKRSKAPKSASPKIHKLTRNARGSLTDSDDLKHDESLSARTKSRERKRTDDRNKYLHPDSRSSTARSGSARRQRSTDYSDSDTETDSDASHSTDSNSDDDEYERKHDSKHRNGSARPSSSLSRNRRQSTRYRIDSLSDDSQSSNADSHKTYTRPKSSPSSGRTSKNVKAKPSHKLSDSRKSAPRIADAHKRNQRKPAVLDEDGFEVYYFVCNRWFATGEDDGQIIRELVPTDEKGTPLEDNAIQQKQYELHVFTGSGSGSGTDANVFITLYGEHGDTGDRQLKESSNRNKFETGQEDVFKISAVDLGHLKKLKIWHDNSGMGAAWFLDRVEVVDKDKKIIFPCEEWLSTKEGDGRICRELIGVDEKMLRGKSSASLKEQFGLEMKAQTTTFNVFVTTGDKRGAGTDANVFIVLYGDKDDTGKVQLKTSLTSSNKFERKQCDQFAVETVDIGNELKKILIGHDNAGGFADWYLEKVDIDCPSLGKKWHFPCSKWIGNDADDGKLERELFPTDLTTEKYETCVPYEFCVYTSDMKGAGTDSDVFVALYGPDGKATRQLSLCPTKRQRKEHFNRGAVDKFIVELEDLEEIVKLRIGHDGESWGSGWHCNQVVVKKLLDRKGETSTAVYTFPCNRWLAKDEDDNSIVRDLVPSTAVVEAHTADGSVKTKELSRSSSVKMKHYKVHVHTGDIWRAGTDANVFLTVYGTLGDSGKRQLKDSETNRNKFERNNTDVFNLEVGDLGQIFKIDIGHDNSSRMGSNWYLSKVDVIDQDEKKTYEFHCERWLAKNKDDGLIERTLFAKDYDPSSGLDSKSTKTSKSAASDRTALTKSSGTARIVDSAENHRSKIIPYMIKLRVGDQKDAGTQAPVWLKMIGGKHNQAHGRIVLTPQSGHLRPGATESFPLDAPDVGKLQSIEIGIDSKAGNDALFIKELQISLPTKGLEWIFHLDQWFGRDKSDGLTKRTFAVDSDNVLEQTFKAHTPYEVYFETADESNAGTDCSVSVQLFGTDGASNEVIIDKLTDRFERGHTSVVKIELEDAGEPRKLRVRLVAPSSKPSRPKWLLESVEMINLFTDKTFVFPCKQWFGLKKDGDCEPSRDLIASTAKGGAIIGTANYVIHVFTSDAIGAGTDANVSCELFDDNGHNSGELKLQQAENATNKFESGKEDVFQFPGLPQLGPLVKVRVWHDNAGFGAAWHLDKIEVHELANKKSYTFPCGQWLSSDEQLSRELFCAQKTAGERSDKRKGDHDEAYEIIVKTGDKRDAGTVHDGTIVLRGAVKDSERFFLFNSPKNKIMRRGQTDSVKLKSTHSHVGKIHSILLGHYPQEDIPVSRNPENERENYWYCEEVTVIDLNDGKKYKFICNEWIPLSAQQKDAIEIACVDSPKNEKNTPKADLSPTTYELIVVTGNERGAGTDANVSVTLFGAKGNSGKQRLTGAKLSNLFEKGQRDTFTIECADLGKLTKLAIEHDNSGFGAGWYLDKVEVKNMKSGETAVFPCNQWLDKSQGDGAIARDLLPSKA